MKPERIGFWLEMIKSSAEVIAKVIDTLAGKLNGEQDQDQSSSSDD